MTNLTKYTSYKPQTGLETQTGRWNILETQVKKKSHQDDREQSIFYINKTKRTNKNVTSYKHLISDIVPLDIHIIK